MSQSTISDTGRFALAAMWLLAWGAAAQTPVSISVNTASPGATIPSDFIGLSFETTFVESALFPYGSAVYRQMLSQLGAGWIRFGGSTVDLTTWVGGQRSSSTPANSLTGSDVDNLMALARAVGWRVLFSLNLPTSTPALDGQEAVYVSQAGSGPLFGFEIGNEPDLYYGNGDEPTSFTLSDYLSDWVTFANAIQAADPGAVLTGPADATDVGTWTAGFAAANGSRIALLTQHYYPLGPVSALGATSPDACTIPNLLDAHTHSKTATEAAQLQTIAQSAKVPWRMSETNSCYEGGTLGVSNTFASALWGLDYMFTVASNGGTGVNFHVGSSGEGPYTPIQVNSSGVTARPLYDALLLFHAASSGRVVPLALSSGGIDVNAYAVLAGDGTLRVAVVNEDASNDASVSITPGAAYTRALALRLTAPALDSTTGFLLGGAAVAADGTWSPAQLETVSATFLFSSGTYSLAVPSGSAVLVGFGGATALGIANTAGGKPQVAANSLAAAYGQNLGFVARNAPSVPLPNTLAGVQATVTDAAGVARPAPLIYVSPSQVNFEVPNGTASGLATVDIAGAGGTVQVNAVAPGLYAVGSAGIAAATAGRYPIGGGPSTPVAVFDCSSGTCVMSPITLDNQSTVYLSLYGTGIRNRSSLANVTCTVGGVSAPVQYAGAQPQDPGLDQVNVALPLTLRGAGTVNVEVTVDGQASNAVQIAIQ
jgi:uncharacterized protein (TIGR03437 family)